MNRAIAVAQIDGPEAGVAILDRLDLDHYRYFHSTRADYGAAPTATTRPTTPTAARSTSRRPSQNSASLPPGQPRPHPPSGKNPAAPAHDERNHRAEFGLSADPRRGARARACVKPPDPLTRLQALALNGPDPGLHHGPLHWCSQASE